MSTAKQGEKGVSLQEQRDAISHFADRNGLKVIEWYEERETAAKRGRPKFTEMLKRLKKGDANGVVIHKIDRSARNLRDWADLGEMIDSGIDVYFANESLDLHSRGGRLSADIQAVIAADYIRNLKEEVRKGFYGRIKQGLYPLPAPIGYLDRGKGQPKVPDPTKAPLIRQTFELYSSRRYSLVELVDAAFALGLRNKHGRKITRSALSDILNNPFYIGLIRLRRTGETFTGIHEPIVKPRLFKRVQEILRGKTVVKLTRPEFQFRRLLKCGHCKYSLVGERHKGHTYYRCYVSTCPGKCVREEKVVEAIDRSFTPLTLDDAEKTYWRQRLQAMRLDATKHVVDQQQSVKLSLAAISDRLNRLTDAYLDSGIDRSTFESRKGILLLEKKQLEEREHELQGNAEQTVETLTRIFELANTAQLSYQLANPVRKRELVEEITSNRFVTAKNVVVELRNPFNLIANRHIEHCSGP
ncbi:MAG: recombinase family protein [Candidatus Zambryskibacteria bacterium]|nr:recombinase family protein [Candidatus Zambryskibacteria bacterium]